MMKRIVTIAIILFWTAYVAIVAGGLAIHKLGGNEGIITNTPAVDTASLGNITLSTTEVAKHSTKTSCWIIVEGKVYDISRYFGNHPGGDIIMVNFCGKEATTAFKLSPHRHSDSATSLLVKYLLGNLGETINQGTTSTQQTAEAPATAPTATTTPSGGATYTTSDVLTHNTKANCWFIVNSRVYNITAYFGSHPGGDQRMLAYCGGDATSAFVGLPHSSSATALLGNYYLGSIGTTTTGTGAVTATPATTAPVSQPVNKDDEYEDD